MNVSRFAVPDLLAALALQVSACAETKNTAAQPKTPAIQGIGQSGAAAVKNIFVWLRQTGANILASGQDGSPTLTGDADSDGPLLTRTGVIQRVARNMLNWIELLGPSPLRQIMYMRPVVLNWSRGSRSLT